MRNTIPFLFLAPWIWITRIWIGWMTVPASTHTQWCAGFPGKTKMQMRSLPSPKRMVWRCRSLWKTRLAHRSLHVARLWGSRGQRTPATSRRNSSRKWTGCPTTWWELQLSMINAKLSGHRFWPCHESRLMCTILTTPHNLFVYYKPASLYCGS